MMTATIPADHTGRVMGLDSLNEWAETVQPEWHKRREWPDELAHDVGSVYMASLRRDKAVTSSFDYDLYHKVVKAKAIERHKAHFYAYAEMVHEVDGTMYVGFTRDEALELARIPSDSETSQEEPRA